MSRDMELIHRTIFFIIYDADGYGYMANHDVVGNVVAQVHFSVAKGEVLEKTLLTFGLGRVNAQWTSLLYLVLASR